MLADSVDERFWSKVDRSGGCWLWLAGFNDKGYGQFWFEGKTWYAHRFAYVSFVGPIPRGKELDHICHVPLCVNPDHLRPVTRKQNIENRGLFRNNTSGVKGVAWNPRSGGWVARVKHNGRSIFVGRFPALELAEAALIAKRNELFTHNDLDRLPATASVVHG